MSSYNDIVDRDSEIESLITAINTNDSFTINILFAPTAIGKSSLTTKLSKRLKDENIECVVVRTNPMNKTTLPEWTFVTCLFDELNRLYQNDACSFDNFINTNEYFIKLKQRHNFDVLKDTNKDNILFKPFLMQQLDALNSIMDILLENENQYLYAKQEYINFILEKKCLVLIIDNLQIIDDYSLSFLKRCFQFNSLQKQYIIFEFTEDSNTYDVLKLSEYFKEENICVKRTPVPKTDSRYIVDIIDRNVSEKPKDFQFNYDLVKHYVDTNTGNIRELIDFSLNYTQPESICTNKTIESLLRLNEVELYILFTLLIFNGSIRLDYLMEFAMHANISHLDEALKALFDKFLIKKNNDTNLVFAHASITDALKSNYPKLIIAQSTTTGLIKSYIESLLNQKVKLDYPLLSAILKIYKEQSPFEIFKLFEYIESSILVNLQPKEAWTYFLAFINVTNDTVRNYLSLYTTIFKLCFKFELYSEGFSVLEKTYSDFDINVSPEIIIYRMLYLAALDKHYENIEYFKSIKDRLLTNERAYLNANLAVLSSYRSLGNTDECLKIHKLLKKRIYKKHIEYGYRNRLVDMYLTRSDAIKYMKRSLKNFDKQNLPEQKAKTLITYTHVLGGLGKIDLAKKQIAQAECLLEGKILGKHMLLVNQAVLDLVDGNFNRETYRLLDMAENSAIVPFDKIAIIVNKLVWCYENNRFDLIHMLAKKSETLLPLEPDRHVHSLLYYNLYACYKKENKNLIANKYLQKAKETMNYCEPVKNRILGKATRETQFILTKPWHICYLTYWTFDVLF